MLSLPNGWEAPLAEIKNSDQLRAWLRTRPHGVSVAFAARVALRALPVVQTAERAGWGFVLTVFRATAVSWTAAKYPAQTTDTIAAAAAAAASNAAESFAYPDEYATAAYDDAVAGANAANAASDAARAADHAANAASEAANAADLSAAAARIILVTSAALWSAISKDVTRVEEGAAAADIAGLPLWLRGQPDQLQASWLALKASLVAAKLDWKVWIDWYEDRLEGRVREEERELAYVRIEEGLWKKGPAIVNAEIKRRIEPRVSAPRTGVSGSRRPVFKGFFSYNHRDAEVDPHIVEAFSSELEKRVDAKLVNARFEIWRDKEKLQVGDYWDQTIEGAIDSSDIFIVLLTPKWISSDYCRKEFEAFEKIEAARNSGGYVIPIYARDIKGQEKYLEAEQKELLARLMRIQNQQVIPKQFARLSDHERIDLIEAVADPICDMLDRLREWPEK
jgi:hypothetical protein